MKWNLQNLQYLAMSIDSKRDFDRKFSGAVRSAKRLDVYDEICFHMVRPGIKWTNKKVFEEALKYRTRSEFAKNSNSAYNVAKKLKILDYVCSHMPNKVVLTGIHHPKFMWTLEKLQEESLKYDTRMAFQKYSQGAYSVARKSGVLNIITTHMPKHKVKDYSGENNPSFKWSKSLIEIEALKYDNRTDFFNNSGGAYMAATRLGILDQTCIHMKKSSNSSKAENELFKEIQKIFPSTKKLRKRNICIPGKPYIKGFGIDIFVPELNKGVEFDGDYFHSFKCMRSSAKKKKWTDEDILHYHEIKDCFFKSQGIEILHIKEVDWIKDRNYCTNLCLSFLNNFIE